MLPFEQKIYKNQLDKLEADVRQTSRDHSAHLYQQHLDRTRENRGDQSSRSRHGDRR